MSHPVTLSGGPMDRWVVTPDAPVLRPGWSAPPVVVRTWRDRMLGRPARVQPVGRPGRYVLDASGRSASWVEG